VQIENKTRQNISTAVWNCYDLTTSERRATRTWYYESLWSFVQ